MLHVAVMEEMSSTLAALLSKSGCDDVSDHNNDDHDNHGSDDSHENHDQASSICEPQEKGYKSDLEKRCIHKQKK